MKQLKKHSEHSEGKGKTNLSEQAHTYTVMITKMRHHYFMSCIVLVGCPNPSWGIGSSQVSCLAALITLHNHLLLKTTTLP